MPEDEIAADDPRAPDVRSLLQRHLDFARATTPPEGVFALDLAGLLDPAVSFYSFRRSGRLLAVGALRHLGGQHAELKSMHTAAEQRGQGIGRAMLAHLVRAARELGVRRLSLETGSMPAFAPARALYASAGFTICGPFGGYPPSVTSTFMTLMLDVPSPGATGPGAPPPDARAGAGPPGLTAAVPDGTGPGGS